MKGFDIICKNCGNTNEIFDKHRGSVMDEDIDIDVTERCNFQGCMVESIDIKCWKCGNEVNI